MKTNTFATLAYKISITKIKENIERPLLIPLKECE